MQPDLKQISRLFVAALWLYVLLIDFASAQIGFPLAAVHKSFHVTEHHSLTFRLEAFSVLNHVVFSNPVNTVTNPQFGRITSGGSGRALKLALKYTF